MRVAVPIAVMQQAPERRVGPRAHFDGRTHVRADDFDIVCQSVNLSSAGMLLLSPVSAEPGLALQLNVFLSPLNKWGETEATLVRQVRHQGQLAWAVRFRETTPFMGTVFRTFVRRSLRGDYATNSADARDGATARKTADATLELLADVASKPAQAPGRTATSTRAASGLSPASDGSSKPPSSGDPSDDEPLDIHLTPSESGLRALYRDAIADLRHEAGHKPRKQKRRLWPFK